jgi:hypothetical protein
MKLSFTLQNPDIFRKVEKNVIFGYARGLTQTAQKAQEDVTEGIRDKFTVRTRWIEKGNKYGIKMTPAKKDNLEAAVWTRADWLKVHEKGGTKEPTRSKNLTVPTNNVKRNKRDLIRKNQRPRSIKRSFVIKTDGGQQLFMERFGKGKRSSTRVMYILEPKARIKKQGTFLEAAQKSVTKNRDKITSRSIDQALRTMR